MVLDCMCLRRSALADDHAPWRFPEISERIIPSTSMGLLLRAVLDHISALTRHERLSKSYLAWATTML